MFLKSLTHRDRLFDIGTDWLEGHVGPDDGRFITTVFLLENAITMPSVAGILARACGVCEGGEIRLRRVRTKEKVRRCIIDGWKAPTLRARRLFEAFERLPASFYPSTPVDVTVATGADAQMPAMVRLKSPWRVATNVLLTSLSMLLLAVAPTVHIEKPPARLSGRSLPETALGVLAQLFQLEVGRSALWVPPSNLTRVHG